MKDSFIALCNFCEKYNNSPTPLKRNDPQCQPAQAALPEIQTWAKKHFSHFKGVAIGVDVSKGAGFYPKVPWICLLPPNQQANNGVYVSICFGSEGHGAVAGLAQSVTNPQGLHIFKRSKNKPLSIDVDGVRSTAKYNDCFQNPQEFLKDTFNEAQFKAHIEDSLTQCTSSPLPSGHQVHSIGGDSLLVCLSPAIPQADVEPLALGLVAWHKALKPAGETTVVFRDSAFADDVAKTNLSAILHQHGLETVRSL